MNTYRTTIAPIGAVICGLLLILMGRAGFAKDDESNRTLMGFGAFLVVLVVVMVVAMRRRARRN